MLQLSKSQLRVLYFYELRRGVAVISATNNINSVYGSSTTTDRTVRNWYRRFQQGERQLEDQPHHRRPLVVEDHALHEAIREDPKTTIRELTTKLGCTHTALKNRLHALDYKQFYQDRCLMPRSRAAPQGVSPRFDDRE